MSAQWFVELEGQEVGPLTSGQLRELAEAGKVQPGTLLRRSDLSRFVPASKVKGLFSERQVGGEPVTSSDRGEAVGGAGSSADVFPVSMPSATPEPVEPDEEEYGISSPMPEASQEAAGTCRSFEILPA